MLSLFRSNRMKLGLVAFLVFLTLGLIYTSSRYTSQSVEEIVDYESKEMTLSGEYLCLPHTQTDGPQTDECAAGIKTNNNTYYALDLGMLQEPYGDVKLGQTITGYGIMTPVQMLSSIHWRAYPITGIFSITKLISVEN